VTVRFRQLDYVNDWEWVTDRLPLKQCEGGTGITAYDDVDGRILAVMVNYNWTPNAVEGHFVIDSMIALRRGFLEECASYLFTQAGRKKAFGQVPSDNEQALRLNKKIGFKELIRLKDVYGDGIDNVILELKREDCKFWNPPALQEAM
jgi:RimJ/RimL family protein N-acetyltransferase